MERSPAPQLSFVIAASFTAEPVEPVFHFWASRLDLPLSVRFAPFNQTLPTLLDEGGLFAANARGLNVVLVRWADLGDTDAAREAHLRELVQAARSRAGHLAAPLLFILTPPAPEAAVALCAAAFEDTPALGHLAPDDIARLYPVERWANPDGERWGRIPYTSEYFAALGTVIVRHAHARYQPPVKVIALDADNTLWEGICGEDGPAGVVLTPAHRALQEFALEHRDAGTLLALASKNNEQDVWDTFAGHPEFPLQQRHFSAWRINWGPKADNLAELAAELNLGLDSFAFLDDNPREVDEVRQHAPEVLSLTLPHDPQEIPRFLRHVWAFDRAAITEEDRYRSAYYERAQEFRRQAGSAASLQDFYRTLDLRLDIQPVGPSTLQRAAQLTQRTNQFNCSTRRRTTGEILTSGLDAHVVTVADRFGEYGVTGLLLTRAAGRKLEVDTFLLSCRVLGRGVEHRLLRWMAERAVTLGLDTVEIPYLTTSRNAPAREFLESAGAERTEPSPAGFIARWDARALSRTELQPAPRPAAPQSAPRASTGLKRTIDYGALASTLATVEQITAAMRAETRNGAGTASDPARSPTEVHLAEIWCDLLKRPSVSRRDNFFDLGGHSLLAVLLLVRIKETFGVELPVDEVYSGSLTLERLARAVDGVGAGLTAGEEAELAAALAALPDDEVRALLVREEAAPSGTSRP